MRILNRDGPRRSRLFWTRTVWVEGERQIFTFSPFSDSLSLLFRPRELFSVLVAGSKNLQSFWTIQFSTEGPYHTILRKWVIRTFYFCPLIKCVTKIPRNSFISPFCLSTMMLTSSPSLTPEQKRSFEISWSKLWTAACTSWFLHLYIKRILGADHQKSREGGAKDFQCMNFFFSPSCLQDFCRHRKSFFGWWTACRNFLFENFPLREFHFGNCRPPPPSCNF